MFLLPLVLALFQVMVELNITFTESCVSGRHKYMEVLPSAPAELFVAWLCPLPHHVAIKAQYLTT